MHQTAQYQLIPSEIVFHVLLTIIGVQAAILASLLQLVAMPTILFYTHRTVLLLRITLAQSAQLLPTFGASPIILVSIQDPRHAQI